MRLLHKSQSAMEFLMTYGWALLVVLIVILALAAFGVLDPDMLLPDKVTVSNQLITIVPTGTNTILVKNEGSDPIQNLKINMSGYGCRYTTPLNLSSRQSKKVMLLCDNIKGGTNTIKSDFLVSYDSYKVKQTLSHSATGRIVTRGSHFGIDKMMGYFPADDSFDYSINGFNVSLMNGASIITIDCKVGGCFSFDGIDDYANTSNTSLIGNFSQSSSWSILLWAKPLSFPTSTNMTAIAGLVNLNGSGIAVGYNYILGLNSANQSVSYVWIGGGSNNVQMLASNTILAANNWYHLAYTVDRSSGIHKFYVNGATNSGNSVVNPTQGPEGSENAMAMALITNNGCVYSNCTFMSRFNGSIDEFMFFNRTLSADEVKAIYEATR